MINNLNEERITTGKVVLHHPHIQNKWAFGNATPKYSALLIVSEKETETLEMIKNAIKRADEKGREIYKDKINENTIFISPLREPNFGATSDILCMNNYSINASTNMAPSMFDKDKNLIFKSDEYMECRYARVSISFHPYFYNDKYGVSCKLHNIQIFEKKLDIKQFMPNPADDF